MNLTVTFLHGKCMRSTPLKVLHPLAAPAAPPRHRRGVCAEAMPDPQTTVTAAMPSTAFAEAPTSPESWVKQAEQRDRHAVRLAMAEA